MQNRYNSQKKFNITSSNKVTLAKKTIPVNKPTTKSEACHSKSTKTSITQEKSRPTSTIQKSSTSSSSTSYKKPTPSPKLEDKSGLQKSSTSSSSSSCKKPTPNPKLEDNSGLQKSSASSSSTSCKKPTPSPKLEDKSGLQKSSASSSSTSCKKPTPSPKLEDNSGLQQKSILNPPSSPGPSLSKEDLERLAAKFGKLSSSILKLATSQKPVGVRSLESLLNREIGKTLGDSVNSPKVSKGFIQATRGLLDSLVCVYEEGKLNTQLFKDKKKEVSYIKANSATTVCYRDQYFKELVMNVLKSMTSADIEEEIAPKAATRSEESKERIRVIRDMVRAEAGLEPENFRQMERRLEELRRSLSRNKLEVQQATNEVDKIISQHVVDRDYLKIPTPAKKVLRASYKESSCSEAGGSGCDSKSDDENSGCESGCTKTSNKRSKCFDGKEKYLESLNILGKENCFENGNSDTVENIRPQIKNLVHEELLRIQMKSEAILNRDMQFNLSNDLENTPKSSLDSIEFKSAASNLSADDDDEITEEETRIFLEALKADIGRRDDDMMINYQNDCARLVLERIDEEEDEDKSKDKNSSENNVSSKHTSVQNTVHNNIACDVETINNEHLDGGSNSVSDVGYNSISEVESNSVSNVGSNSVSDVGSNSVSDDGSNSVSDVGNLSHTSLVEKSKEINNHITCQLENKQEGKFNPERVKSKWWSENESDLNTVFTEMKEAFEMFKVMSDDNCNDIKVSDNIKNETGDADEIIKQCYYTRSTEDNICLRDFTVDEVVSALTDISVKINHLPKYLQEIASSISTTQKEQAFTILSVLGKCMNTSYSVNPDMASFSDGNPVTLPFTKVAKTFSFLSDTLSRSPEEMKSKPITVLNPPTSLIETLTVLASTTYFRECFESAKQTQNNQSIGNKTIEIVKAYDVNEQRSSGEMLTYESHEKHTSEIKASEENKKIHTFMRDVKSPDDVSKNIANFEHFMGLTASVMTVQNVSDMFLFLSTVLNDIPDRLKSENILDLNPPSSLLKALDILYCGDVGDSITEVDKKKSFSSLTVQNVSDFLLTLSKTFDDIPQRMKDSVILNLNPPQSLLRAMTLLTSLSHFSIQESYSQEWTEQVHQTHSFIESKENQDKFFDAVDSLGSLNVKPGS